eukprot:3865447-Pyramimonas_sp.AAC.1
MSEGNMEENRRTNKLVQRLLDSHILTSCEPVFEAFDETLMFDASAGASQPQQAALKSQFKGIFQNCLLYTSDAADDTPC